MQVKECALKVMPAVDSVKLLRSSEEKLLDAAKTPKERADANAVIAKLNAKSSS